MRRHRRRPAAISRPQVTASKGMTGRSFWQTAIARTARPFLPRVYAPAPRKTAAATILRTDPPIRKIHRGESVGPEAIAGLRPKPNRSTTGSGSGLRAAGLQIPVARLSPLELDRTPRAHRLRGRFGQGKGCNAIGVAHGRPCASSQHLGEVVHLPTVGFPISLEEEVLERVGLGAGLGPDTRGALRDVAGPGHPG